MGQPDSGHTHPHEDSSSAWFRGLDVIVWAAVGIIIVLVAEWVGGYLVRERLARSARKYLDRVDELRNP
jgi:hypothetical protein